MSNNIIVCRQFMHTAFYVPKVTKWLSISRLLILHFFKFFPIFPIISEKFYSPTLQNFTKFYFSTWAKSVRRRVGVQLAWGLERWILCSSDSSPTNSPQINKIRVPLQKWYELSSNSQKNTNMSKPLFKWCQSSVVMGTSPQEAEIQTCQYRTFMNIWNCIMLKMLIFHWAGYFNWQRPTKVSGRCFQSCFLWTFSKKAKETNVKKCGKAGEKGQGTAHSWQELMLFLACSETNALLTEKLTCLQVSNNIHWIIK